MAAHNDLGKKGEEAAVAYLEKIGYEILERNWFFRKYEIDIIARNSDYIVFAEVKARTSVEWGKPEDAISKAKMKRMIEAADFYLIEHDINQPARFDVLALVWHENQFQIDHIDDAFLPFIE